MFDLLSETSGIGEAASGFSFPWGAAVGAVGGLLGGSSANAAAAARAREQMAFQERMDNTRYQRMVADLKAAGLNPMLAVSHGPGSAPGGAMAPVMNVGAAAAEGAGRGAMAQLTASEIRLKEAQAATESARAANINENTLLMATQHGVGPAQVAHLYAGAGSAAASADYTRTLQANYGTLMRKVEAETAEVWSRIPVHQQDVVLKSALAAEAAQRLGLIKAETALAWKRGDLTVAQTGLTSAEIARVGQETLKLGYEIQHNLPATARHLNLQSDILNIQRPVHELEANIAGGQGGAVREVMAPIREILGSIPVPGVLLGMGRSSPSRSEPDRKWPRK